MIHSGPISILIASLIFGIAGAVVKVLDMHVTALAWFRLAAPTLFVILLRPSLFRDLARKPNKVMLAASTLTAVRILLWMTALMLASLSKAVFMLYAWPIFFTILNAAFLGERIAGRTRLLLATAFAGIVVMYSGEDLSVDNRDLLGMGIMLIVACLNAIVLTIFKRELREQSAENVLLYDNVIGSIVFLPFFLYHLNEITISSSALATLYGVMTGVLAYLLLYRALKVVKGSTAAILSYMEVVSATLCGIIIFHEAFTWRVAVGGALIILSAFFVQSSKPLPSDSDELSRSESGIKGPSIS